MSPEIITGASAAAYAAGQAVHQLMLRKAAGDVQPVSAEMNAAFIEPSQATNLREAQKTDMAYQVRRAGLRLAVGEAVFGATASFLLLTGLSDAAPQQVRPTVEMVVDHSSTTEYPLSGKPTIAAINQAVEQFAANKDLRTRAIVSNAGQRTAVADVAKISSMIVAGAPDLATPTVDALGRTAGIIPEYGTTKRNAAVVVITGGNSLGDPKVIIDESKKRGGTPVYILNPKAAETDPAIRGQMREIAGQTNGKYLETATELNRADQLVKSNVAGTVPVETNRTLRKSLLFFAGLCAVGAAAAAYRTRYPHRDKNSF